MTSPSTILSRLLALNSHIIILTPVDFVEMRSRDKMNEILSDNKIKVMISGLPLLLPETEYQFYNS